MFLNSAGFSCIHRQLLVSEAAVSWVDLPAGVMRRLAICFLPSSRLTQSGSQGCWQGSREQQETLFQSLLVLYLLLPHWAKQAPLGQASHVLVCSFAQPAFTKHHTLCYTVKKLQKCSFFTVLVQEHLRSKCRQAWFLPRPLSSACRWPLFCCLFTWSFLWMCFPGVSPYKDINHFELGHYPKATVLT